MEKKKLEQVILIALIPVLILSLVYVRLKKGRVPEGGYEMPRLEAKYAEDEVIDTIPRPAGVLNVRYEGSTEDPLKDMLQTYLHELKLKEIKKPKKPEREFIPLPRLNIGGLIWDTDMPQAIINGKVIKIGDTIEGVKIVGIEKTGVTVMHQGEAVFIPRK